MEVARLILEYIKVLGPFVLIWLFRQHVRLLVERLTDPSARGTWKLPGGIEFIRQEALEAGKAGAALERGEEALEETQQERRQLVERFAEAAGVEPEERVAFLAALREKDEEVQSLLEKVARLEERLVSKTLVTEVDVNRHLPELIRLLRSQDKVGLATLLEGTAIIKVRNNVDGTASVWIETVAENCPRIHPNDLSYAEKALSDLVRYPIDLSFRWRQPRFHLTPD